MGEAKRKNRTRQEVIASEPRCIYCPDPAETCEHMPPLGMFRDHQRPGGMEYAACKACNNGTRGSDAVAALMARLHPDNGKESWQAAEVRKLRSAVDAYAPGVREEMSLPGKFSHEWARRPGSGLLQRVVRVHADGPRVQAHLSIFGAKLAMALYREHVGVALPLDGAVIVAVAQFHRGLWFTIFASSDHRVIELLKKPELLQVPASVLVRPGELFSVGARVDSDNRP